MLQRSNRNVVDTVKQAQVVYIKVTTIFLKLADIQVKISRIAIIIR